MKAHQLTDYQFEKLDVLYRAKSKLLNENQQEINRRTTIMNNEMARMLGFKDAEEATANGQKLEIDWIKREVKII